MAGSRARRAWTSLVLVTLGAGCGGSQFRHGAGPSQPPPSPVSTAAPSTTARRAVVHRPELRAALVRSVSATTSARTARTAISVTVTGLGEDALETGAFDVAGSGVVDLASGNADLSLSIPLFDRLGGGGGTIEERIVGGTRYARLPAAVLRAGGLTPVVRWLRIDPLRRGESDPATLSQSQVDPAGQLAFLGAISDDVRRVGVDPVRGTRTTHFAATLGPPARKGRTAPATSVVEQLGPVGAVIDAGPLTVDVWIDSAARARRIVVSVPLATVTAVGRGSGAGVRAAMRIQADFYSFGIPVRVTAPPAAQVRPYRALHVPATGR